MKAIVTVKLPRDPKHDPKNKKSGKCPLFSKKIQGVELQGSFLCTDVTGSHHSYIQYGKDLKDIREKAQRRFGHITRIEVQ